jgi:hypothetical protein
VPNIHSKKKKNQPTTTTTTTMKKPSALAHNKGKEEAKLLLRRIYDTLQEYPHSEMAWVRDCPVDGPLTKQQREWWFAFADDMVDLFWSLHGKEAMPCESHEMTLAKEAEGMGATVVVVSFPLKVTLQGSPKCPNMASYRSGFYDAMLKIPDVVLDSNDKTHMRIKKIKDGVVRFFNEVRPDQAHFKRPPKGNQRLVVPTDGAFVIDFNLFQLDAVHRSQAAQGHNICLKTVFHWLHMRKKQNTHIHTHIYIYSSVHIFLL